MTVRFFCALWFDANTETGGDHENPKTGEDFVAIDEETLIDSVNEINETIVFDIRLEIGQKSFRSSQRINKAAMVCFTFAAALASCTTYPFEPPQKDIQHRIKLGS